MTTILLMAIASSVSIAASIDGKITCDDEKHSAAVGVMVELWNTNESGKQERKSGVATTTAGDFNFAGLSPGTYQLKFRWRPTKADDVLLDYYIPRASDEIKLDKHSEIHRPVVALRGATITGKAVLDRKPSAGALVTTKSSSLESLIKTDDKGIFRLTGVRPGQDALVEILCNTERVRYLKRNVVKADRVKAGATIELPDVVFETLSGINNLSGVLQNADGSRHAGIRPLPAISEDGKLKFLLIFRDGVLNTELFPGKYKVFNDAFADEQSPLATIEVPAQNVVLKLNKK